MKIKMKTNIAGPGFTAFPGEVVDVDEKQAEALIKAGFAEAAEPKADGDTAKYSYKDTEYTAEELLELAKKAKLPENVSNPNTIIKKLTELDFDPNSGGADE